MPIYAATRDRSPDDIRAALTNLVRNFESDAAGSRKQIRDLMDNDRNLFFASAMEIVKSAGDSRGGQFVVALFAANGMLLKALCDSTLSREQALALGRAAKRVDPMVDSALARGLADSAIGDSAVVVSDPARLMEIICEIADPARIMPSLMRLLRHPNTYLRSKAVKMIGRGSRSVKWVMGRLSESDPRIRANAIESLWGVETPEARTLLNFAASDANNRVVGNALLGLYYIGEAGVLTEITRLAAHESALFRATATWVMGESGDPRFTDSLRKLISEADPMVRKRAFAALSRIKSANAQPMQGQPWHIAGRILAGESIKGIRRALIAVASEDMRDQPKVAPLQFLLSEAGQYITSYKVVEKPPPEAISVIFVIPRSRDAAGGAFFSAAARCLTWKRPSDLWSILPYIEAGDGEPPAPHDPDPAEFTAKSEALAATLQGTPKRIECTDLWTALWRASRPDAGQSRGRRHVIVFSSAEESRIAGHGLISTVQTGRVPLQAICAGPNAELQEFCKRTRMPLQLGVQDEISELVERAYLNLLTRYEISYQPVSTEPVPLKVRVQSPTGWGEAVIPFYSEAL
uniref:PBS lyase HEAT domain protein repeat-containing protein n=1 Tax=Solibacter usitatus (strain Ellin6076) TaxID=234267 RepID=Q029J2_SOLUE